MTTAEPLDLATVGQVVLEIFPEALGAWIHGSHADGSARADSDVDIAILPEAPLDHPDLLARAQDVARRIGREVDLVDLLRVSTVLRYEATVRGRLVATRDLEACDRFAMTAMSMYQRLNEDQTAHLGELVRRAWEAT